MAEAFAQAAAAPVVPAAAAPAPVVPAYVAAPVAPIDLDSAVKASELQVIMAAIESTDSRMEAAAKLGISPRTLRYKLAQMRTRGMTEGASA
jgi:two-component system response regulator FlrC